MKSLVLASGSPRRKELLSQLGYQFDVRPVDIDETPLPDEQASDYLVRMSTSKARAALSRIQEGGEDTRSLIILASDTSVIAGDEILGKPENYEDFCRIMALLSGGWHQVMTSIALLEDSGTGTELIEQTVVTNVQFKHLTEQEILAYWKTSEPVDKAGGYGIQGKGAVFVETIEGSYSNVVGLPLYETSNLLAGKGIELTGIWLQSNSQTV